jgi:hypothetical protein
MARDMKHVSRVSLWAVWNLPALTAGAGTWLPGRGESLLQDGTQTTKPASQ